MTTTGRRFGPRHFTWFAAGCVSLTVALDRVVILLVDVYGAQVAVPGGRYRGGDLTGRVGDGVDIALAAAVVVLGIWALWSTRAAGARTGYLVASVAVAVVVSAGLIAAVFFTPLSYSLSPEAAAGDDLTFGQAPGPYWFQVARPLLLSLAVLGILATVVSAAIAGADGRSPALEPAEASGAGAGRAVTIAAVATTVAAGLLLALNVSVALIAGTSPAGTLLPLAVSAPVAALTILISARIRRGAVNRRTLLSVGAGILAPLWCGMAVWLVLTDPLVVEPSPVDDAARAGLEPWVAPSLLVLAALVVTAQVVWLVAVTRRPRFGRD